MVSLFGQKRKNFQSFLPFVIKPTQLQFSIRRHLDLYINENTLQRNVMLAEIGKKCPKSDESVHKWTIAFDIRKQKWTKSFEIRQ